MAFSPTEFFSLLARAKLRAGRGEGNRKRMPLHGMPACAPAVWRRSSHIVVAWPVRSIRTRDAGPGRIDDRDRIVSAVPPAAGGWLGDILTRDVRGVQTSSMSDF